MTIKHLILQFVAALIVLLPTSARAAEHTFTYEATVTTAEPGAPAAVGELVRITFTFSDSVPGTFFPQIGRMAYPFVEATGRAGNKSWSFDIGFIGVQNDFTEDGLTFNDQYTVFLGQATATPVEFVLNLSSSGPTPPDGLTDLGLPLIPPNPAAFQSKYVLVQSWNATDGYLTAIAPNPADQPTCLANQALTLSGGTLTLRYRLALTTPRTWNLFVTAQNTTARLLSIPLPVIDPPVSFDIPVPNFPGLGIVGFLTTMTDNQKGIVCSDWDILDSGAAGTASSSVEAVAGLFKSSK